MRVALAATALLVVCFAAFAQKGDDKATFAAMYKQAEKAFETKNVKMLQGWMTPDYTEGAMGKTMNAQQAMKDLQQFFGMFKTLHMKFVVHSVKVNGNMATTTDTGHLWGDSSMVDPKSKKSHKVSASRDETMTWVKMGNRWAVKKIVATNEKMMMDGKPYMPQMPKRK